ncbi:MAG TPA: hypothetical protein VM911_04005 [Pyrinomonadaceae bacterium]|jgi:uncharacterized circularly permuted ATP-grasp superfamily protein|nr:hypothetical protein [Pyrinomonadaceae bacterium]
MSNPKQLASTVSRLDERIARDASIGPPLFEQLLNTQRELGLLHDERPTCPFLRPLILSRSQYTRVARAAETLAAAFERLAHAALQDDALMNELDLTEREKRMARFDPGYQTLCVTSRLDAYLDGEDFQFLEYNAESPAGIADQMQLEKVLFGLPHMKEFLAEHGAHWLPRPHQALLRAMLETYREWSGHRSEHAQIAIVDWEGVSTASEFEILKDYFEAEGYRTIIADPRSLEYDGQELRAGDFRIDILYKRVIIHEFLEKFDETHPLARAYIEHKVCLINSFRTKLAHKKAGFAILSDPAYHYLFTPEQVACILKHIPWTRRVRDGKTTYRGAERDLLDVLLKERERLVIKPNDDYGGHGVVIGWETDTSAWEEAIRLALQNSFVVQERVMVEKARMAMFTADSLFTDEMFIDFNPFLFLNRVEGALVRLSASSLCNVSSGGGETALLVLENF